MVSSTLSYDNLSRSEKILLQNGIRPIFKNKVTASISQKTNQDKNSTSFKLNDQSDTSGVNVALSITVQEKEKINDLKKREQEVITHENAHKQTGGQYAQSPNYTYTTGPDGKKYITDGSVNISLSEESTPDETIAKMEQVRSAALAPSEPSSADLKVANEAAQIAKKAQAEKNEQLLENPNSLNKDDIVASTSSIEPTTSNIGNLTNEAISSDSNNERNILKSTILAIQRRYQASYAPRNLGSRINSYS